MKPRFIRLAFRLLPPSLLPLLLVLGLWSVVQLSAAEDPPAPAAKPTAEQPTAEQPADGKSPVDSRQSAAKKEPADQAPASKEPAKQPAKKPTTSSGLDDELLRGLGGDSLDDLLPPAAKPALPEQPNTPDKKPAGKDQPDGKAANGQKPSGQKVDDSLDRQLLEGLGGEGEDLGQEGDPLVKLGQQMKQSGTLISQAKTGQTTQQLQDKIVQELDELIKQARQQQQQQSSSSSSSQSKSSAQRQQVKQPQPSPSGQAGRDPNNQPARESTDRVGKSELNPVDMAQMNDVIKKIWGALPEKQREQLLQNSVDQFLPKYELLIEEYFKALSEREAQRP